jgi:lysophospholipase L1-like esterase
VLLVGLNLFSYAGLTAFRSVRALVGAGDMSTQPDGRWTLPNYEGRREWARLIFEEFNALRSQYEPFVGWSRLPFSGNVTTVNGDGDRVHPVPERAAEPRGVVRFFGGSTMWGTGAEDGGTIPALFNQMYPEFVIHNHGESAFNSRQSLERLVTLLSTGERVDLAVFLDGTNDVLQCMAGISVPGHSRMLQIRDALDKLRGRTTALGRFGEVVYALFLKGTVSATRSVGRRVFPRRDGRGTAGTRDLGGYECDDDPDKAEAVAETMIRNWQLARTLVEAHGGRFLGLLQPNSHIGSPRTDHLVGRLDEELGRNYQAVYPLARALIREMQSPWMVDLSGLFDGDMILLIDDFHVTEKGNQILAERISELLGARGWPSAN